MMTWKQKCEEKRYFYIIAWTWDKSKGEYIHRTVREELTCDEGVKIFDQMGIDPDKNHQIELWREFEDTNERIVYKTEDADGTFTEWENRYLLEGYERS